MKVLVIDDDPAIVEQLKTLLAPGTVFLITRDCAEAILMVKENRPEIVIIDTSTGQIDCRQVCRDIRKLSPVPILLLSASDSPQAVAAALEAGADEYLIKPVSNGELLANINKFLRRTQPRFLLQQSPINLF